MGYLIHDKLLFSLNVRVPTQQHLRAQVKYSTTGVTDAVWKCIETKEIVYKVMTTALLEQAVVVVTDV